ncbi:TetR family transcriptional regulator [Agromyces fucosus]|uniref:TetR family transcriptional regulator n=1 Tax=Agromyces fucosus TaxID=41985 RepID=A0A4V1QS59_9MICO|nr:TetR/AcrR family transcriptional regulator C-terminal ligand-binding domain-containing protein [Agromyces fucosus]RXZ47253.1 TetR family transcriptional regulator [Agromyces fucosus]
MSTPSSPSRSYRSTLRAEQAAATRRRILAAAGASFASAGYAGTSLADIAREASVSVETVKLNGPKRELLLASFEQAFAGDEGHEGIAEREVGRRIMEVGDPDELLAAWVRFVAEANARAGRLWRSLVSAGTSDPLVREALDAQQVRRHADFRAAIDLFVERGMHRGDAPSDAERDRLADVLSFLASPEGYEQLVDGAGWSQPEFEAWLAGAVRTLVLG